jgi:hypothetical protein
MAPLPLPCAEMANPLYIHPDGRMTTKVAARYTGMSVKTLAQWRYQGKGPAFTKPSNGYVYYFKDDLDAWLLATKGTSTQQVAFNIRKGGTTNV